MAAALLATIGTYDYKHGGDQNNRRIQFSRTGVGANTIQARVFDLANNVIGNLVATIPGNSINVEMESTTSKLHAKILGRDLVPDQLLSALSTAQQVGLMGSLAQRRIHVVNSSTGPISLSISSL
jgi:hypothetical protein